MTLTSIQEAFNQASEYVGVSDGVKWRDIARPEQVRPEGCVHWLYLAGRGAGKTRSAAERIRERVLSGEAKYIALVGATFADVRDIMVEGESGLKVVCGDLIETYNRSMGEVRFRGGAWARFFSGEDPDALRGWQSTDVWGDEVCAWARGKQTYDMAMLGLRLGNPEAIWTTTPKPTEALRELMKEKSLVITRSSTYANRDNLAPAFFESIIRKYEGSRIGRQELEGEMLEDIEGALWIRSVFDREGFRQPFAFYEKKVTNSEGKTFRQMVFRPPVELTRIAVVLDPSGSNPERKKNPNKELDPCGLVVVGQEAETGDFVVLGDFTALMTPAEWGQKAVFLYGLTQANMIVAEGNYGGEMVPEVISHYGQNLPIELVFASKSKRARAEPLAVLYEQGRVKHCGNLNAMEDEMCTWDASDGSPSPNRIDAAVWGSHAFGLCQVTGQSIQSRITSN